MLRLAVEKDIETLRQAALLLEAENQKLVDENVKLTRELLAAQGASPEQLRLKLAELERQLANARRRIYGDSAERRHYHKRGRVKGKGKTEGKAEPQRGHGPKPQPKLRQVEDVCELEASGESVCEHCGKPVQEWPGQFEEAEEIDVIEREFVIKKIKRKKARCACYRTIVTAPPSPKLFPGARYSIGFAILVVVSKYVDHLPLDRQVRMMARGGLDTESQTLWDYVNAVAQLLRPAHEQLLEYILSKPVIGADETWWRLMGAKSEQAGSDGKRWQVWAACTDDAVCFHLEDSRSTEAAERLLLDYDGIVMCDGYGVYASLAKKTGRFTLANCWAHARRKLIEVEEAFQGEVKVALDLIDELFAIDALCPAGPDGNEIRRRLRNERSRGVVEKLKQWIGSVQALPEGGLRKAINYITGLWDGLTLFLSDPRVPLSNNHTERSLRNPVVGRKNHYGSKSRRGTEAAAILYSLVDSARLVDLEPKAYLHRAIRAALDGRPIPLPHQVVRDLTD
jgi:transposase